MSSTLPDPVLVPVPDRILVPVPISTTALVSVPAPDPVPSCVLPRVSTPVLVPVPTSSPLLSPFPLCVWLFTSTPVIIPALTSSPSPCTSPFPPPTTIPPPAPFPYSRPSGRSTFSVQCVNGAIKCPRAPPPVCRDDDACGRKVPDHVHNPRVVTYPSTPLLHPPRARPRSRLRCHPRPRSHLCFYSSFHPRSRSRPRSYNVFVHGSLPSFLCSFPPRPRSRLRFHFTFIRSPPSSSRSRSIPVAILIYVLVPAPDPVPVSVSAPDSDPAPDPVRSFPSLGPGYPLGTTRVHRHGALRTELSGARKRHPLPTEMMTRAELKCLL